MEILYWGYNLERIQVGGCSWFICLHNPMLEPDPASCRTAVRLTITMSYPDLELSGSVAPGSLPGNRGARGRAQ